MFSLFEACLQEKNLTPKDMSESLKFPYRKFWKESLFVQYYKK